MEKTKIMVCNERLEVPQAGGDMVGEPIRYVGTMAIQSTAWIVSETDGMLPSDQDVRYFHFGMEIKPEDRQINKQKTVAQTMTERKRRGDPSWNPPNHLVPNDPALPVCSFTTPINMASGYRKAIGQLATLFLRERYTALADVTSCLIRPTMDFRESKAEAGKAAKKQKVRIAAFMILVRRTQHVCV